MPAVRGAHESQPTLLVSFRADKSSTSDFTPLQYVLHTKHVFSAKHTPDSRPERHETVQQRYHRLYLAFSFSFFISHTDEVSLR